MLKSTTFIVSFIWSIAKGISRNPLLSMLLLRSRNVQIEIVIPELKKEPEFNKNTICLATYIKHKNDKKEKGRIQRFSLSTLPDFPNTEFYLN